MDMWRRDAFIVLVNQWKSSFDYFFWFLMLMVRFFLVTLLLYMVLVMLVSSIFVNCNTQKADLKGKNEQNTTHRKTERMETN